MAILHIAGLSGSLREKSYNTGLLRAAQRYGAEHDMEIEMIEIGSLPLFSEDGESPLPAAVVAFKEKIATADGVLFVTPEYNYSISGSLKNAIEWGTRPYGNNSFNDKPAGIMSVSVGILGGVRAQYHLRQILVSPNMHVMNYPEVMVGQAKEKFNEVGELVDEPTQKRVKEFLAAFAEWVKKFQ